MNYICNSCWEYSEWGWHYENIVEGFEQVKDNYKNTLIWEFYHHDIIKGPLKTYKL